MVTSHSFLTRGLQKGFAGETKFQTADRAGFSLQTSHFEEDGATYHDEWAADRTGGGQELVKVGDVAYTRVYAGGTPSENALQKLGITKKDIMAYLITCLKEIGENTRLATDFGPRQDGEWSYQYRVLEKNDAIPMITGKEEISYKGKVVFVHVFVMCPVE